MTWKHFQMQEEYYSNKRSVTWVILMKGIRYTKKFRKLCFKWLMWPILAWLGKITDRDNHRYWWGHHPTVAASVSAVSAPLWNPNSRSGPVSIHILISGSVRFKWMYWLKIHTKILWWNDVYEQFHWTSSLVLLQSANCIFCKILQLSSILCDQIYAMNLK